MKRLFTIAAALLFLVGCKQSDNQSVDMNPDFLKIATDRYSVRSFSSTPVAQDTIDLILRAGQVAPTAVNSQPQKIYVVKSEEKMALLNEASPCMYGAPHCFVVCYTDANAVKRGEGTYGEIDATIVLTHMTLEAASLGIGSCIVGYFDEGKVRSALRIPDSVHPVLLLPFGYASPDALPSDRHASYRDLTETVEYR
ncbi:MAG: nitroreductase family protein [Bacteroidales bacterium]|nr:nitroreductase family protein [Bacteroidales bacterium]